MVKISLTHMRMCNMFIHSLTPLTPLFFFFIPLLLVHLWIWSTEFTIVLNYYAFIFTLYKYFINLVFLFIYKKKTAWLGCTIWFTRLRTNFIYFKWFKYIICCEFNILKNFQNHIYSFYSFIILNSFFCCCLLI